MIYCIFKELFAGADLSFYILILCVTFVHLTVKTLRRRIKQYRYDHKNRIEEKQRINIEKEELERFGREQIAKIEMEDFWYGK